MLEVPLVTRFGDIIMLIMFINFIFFLFFLLVSSIATDMVKYS